MLEELIKLLKKHKITEINSADDTRRRVANAVVDYLDVFPAVCNVELSEALRDILGEGFIFKRNRYRAHDLTIPSFNEYLKNSADFHHLSVNDAIKKIMKLDCFEVVVGYNKGERGKFIYFKKDSDLKEYLVPRIHEVKRAVHYLFSPRPFGDLESF